MSFVIASSFFGVASSPNILATTDYARPAITIVLAFGFAVVLWAQAKAWLAPLASFGLFWCSWHIYNLVSSSITHAVNLIWGETGFNPDTNPLFAGDMRVTKLVTILNPVHATVIVAALGIALAWWMWAQTTQWDDRLGKLGRFTAIFCTYVAVVVAWHWGVYFKQIT